MAIILSLALTLVAVACQPASAGATAALQYTETTVQRGNLSVESTSSGNLIYSVKEDVTFEVGGTDAAPITVKEILVKAGDAVKKGNALIRLDTKTLEDAVKTAELAYQDAQLSYLQQQLSTKQQEWSLKGTQIDYDQAVRAVQQATPSSANTWVYYNDMATVGLNIGLAMGAIDDAFAGMDEEEVIVADKSYLQRIRDYLGLAQAASKTSIFVDVQPGQRASSAVAAMQSLLDAQEKAKQSLERALLSMQSSRASLERSQISLSRSKDNLDDAKANLQKTTLVAPFNGFVTNIPVVGGTNVRRGMVGVSIADPDKFEVDVLVNEKDIFKIDVGGQAWISVEALPGIRVPAKVAEISPTATIQSGVVNYKVKVEVQQQTAATTTQPPAATTPPTGAQGAQPGRTPGATGLSAEDIRQRVAERATERTASGGAVTPGQGQMRVTTPAPGQASSAAAQPVKLREGLSVTVSISLAQKSNVLMVPAGAISRAGGQSQIQVIRSDGVLEPRAVETGITNYQYTEIVSGLNEGEKIAVPKSTRSGSSSTGNNPQPPPPPGMMPNIRIR